MFKIVIYEGCNDGEDVLYIGLEYGLKYLFFVGVEEGCVYDEVGSNNRFGDVQQEVDDY